MLLTMTLSGCANMLPSNEVLPPKIYSGSLTAPKDAPLVQLVGHARQQSLLNAGSAARNNEPKRVHQNKSIQIAQPLKRSSENSFVDLETVMDKTDISFDDVLAQTASPASSSGDSAVYPLYDGIEAFAARSAFIKNASSSLDLQYYNLERGLSTRLLLREIVEAAERGVRVRILLDDRGQLGRDKDMLILNAHPNIEVRVYNPIKRFRGNLVTRWAVFLSNLSTLRRRMHIKMWLADGVLGITGGRNLGDRYFNAGEDDNFSDMDVLIAGRAVNDMQQGFDQYWNSDQVIPMDYFDAKHLSLRREQISKMLFNTSRLTRKERVQRHPYLQVLKQTEDSMLDEVVRKMVWGSVDFVMDPANKITVPAEPPMISLAKEGEIRSNMPVFDRLHQAMTQAQKEVFIVSPYFVPGDELVESIISLQKRGVRVILLTNSLESNDVPVVNGHYDQYRDRLLAAGVAVYEMRGYPDVAPEPKWRHPIFSIRGSRTALHSKVVLIDGKVSFVGSMNLDHCSVTGNTEVGAFIAQPVFTERLRQLFLMQLRSQYSYQVRLDENNKAYWYLQSSPKQGEFTADQPASDRKITREPGSAWRHLQKNVGSWFPEHYM